MFSTDAYDENALAEYLRSGYHFDLDFISKNTLKGEINGVQLDCIAHQYPWINSSVLEDNIRLASYDDIAAMKLNVIAGNGIRIKDFIDIAFLSCKMIMTTNSARSYNCKDEELPIVCKFAVFSLKHNLADFTAYSPRFNQAYASGFG